MFGPGGTLESEHLKGMQEKPSVMVQASTQEAEVGGSQVQGQPGQLSETLCQ